MDMRGGERGKYYLRYLAWAGLDKITTATGAPTVQPTTTANTCKFAPPPAARTEPA